ncbi:hypothetical protein BH11PAT1_BH11PAT1_1570 [soil metagenome]
MNKDSLFKRIDRSRTFDNILSIYYLRDKKVLDIGCGHGQYLKHFGAGSAGITTAPDEVQFGKENNLKIMLGNAESLYKVDFNTQFEGFWANNLFEHLLSPHAFLMNLKKFSTPESLCIIGVPVVPKFAWLINIRQWRGTLASNHVNFFTDTTLGLTVERAGWDVIEVRPFIFKNKFLDMLAKPFAPHMYAVAKNNADFKYPPKKVHEWIDDPYYKDLLTITSQYEQK